MSHGTGYLELVARAGERELDSSYLAAFYLLSYDSELAKVVSNYVSIQGIHFTGIKRATREFGEISKQIVDIAHNLFSWNSKCKVSPFDMSRLGYPHVEYICNALFIANGEYEIVIETDKENQPILRLDDSHYQKTIQFHEKLEAVYEGMRMKAEIETDMVTER